MSEIAIIAVELAIKNNEDRILSLVRVNLLLATVFLKRVPLGDNGITLGTEEVSVEKKHKNIKHLMAMDANTDLSKRATRKFPGIGPSIFQVDFEKQFAAYRNIDESAEGGAASAMSKPGSPPASALGPEGDEI